MVRTGWKVAGVLSAALAGCGASHAAGALPGDAMPANARACFSHSPEEGGAVKRLLLELHKEQGEGQEEATIWARVYAEKEGEALPGYNYDGCSPYKDGDTSRKFDYLHCGFACDSGSLQIRLSGDGLAISPDHLFLRSCGVGEGKIGGFQIRAEDVNGTATVLPVDDAECRSVMAPMEKIMDDAEAGFE
jgi:hypothetical protein